MKTVTFDETKWQLVPKELSFFQRQDVVVKAGMWPESNKDAIPEAFHAAVNGYHKAIIAATRKDEL